MPNEFRNNRRPAGLLARPQAAARFGMKVLVEPQVIAPQRILLKHIVLPQVRSVALRIAQKDRHKMINYLLSCLLKGEGLICLLRW